MEEVTNRMLFDEEFSDYLDGQIPGDMLENHLKSRVVL